MSEMQAKQTGYPTRLEDAARKYYAPLLSFFRKRVANSQDAKDLVQQVFLRLSQQPTLEKVENIEAYLFQTASNAWKDYLRSNTVRSAFGAERDERDNDGVQEVNTEHSPERVALGEEAIEVMLFALRELPERTRDVFVLRCIDGLKHAEVAQLFGISVRAVEKHVSKALAHITCALV